MEYKCKTIVNLSILVHIIEKEYLLKHEKQGSINVKKGSTVYLQFHLTSSFPAYPHIPVFLNIHKTIGNRFE